jgi:hypothetical protein
MAYDRKWHVLDGKESHLLLEFKMLNKPKQSYLKHSIIKDNIVSALWKSEPDYGKYHFGLNLITDDPNIDIPTDIIQKIVLCLSEYGAEFDNIRIDNRFGDIDLTNLKYVPHRLTLIDCLFEKLEITGIQKLHITGRDWGVKSGRIHISFDLCQDMNDVKIIGKYPLRKRTMYNLLKLPKLCHLLIKKT